jgi:16S rRNA (cytosine1407-C5)-methyltransferase
MAEYLCSETPDSLPSDFVRRLRAIVPKQHLDVVLASFAGEKQVAARINTLHISVPAALSCLHALGLSPRALPFVAGALVFPSGQRSALLSSPLCAQGGLYLQGASSLLPAVVLNPQPQEEVLDMAAAPGGKTLQIACLMQDRGRIAAVEAVRSRFFKLKANVAAQGAQIVYCYHTDGATLWRKVPERFDRILLDAPCSSEARFRAGEGRSSAHWSLRKVEEMARKQKQLLHSAVHCLKPGGELVYSTCSLSPEENEAVIARALAVFGEALSVESIELRAAGEMAGSLGLASAPTLVPGLTEWGRERFPDVIAKAVRVLPDYLYDGFFMCRLRKRESTR